MTSFREDSSEENNEFDPTAEFEPNFEAHRSIETRQQLSEFPPTPPMLGIFQGFTPRQIIDASLGSDSGSDDEDNPETERLRRRQQAIDSTLLNLRCELPQCSLEPWMVRAPRLQRQKACAYQEVVHLPCQNCGDLIETVIRY